MRVLFLRSGKLFVHLAVIFLSIGVMAATKHVNVGPGISFTDVTSSSTGPAVTNITVGDTVVWDWQGGFHSTTSTNLPCCSANGMWDSGATSTLPHSFSFTFNSPGTFHYFCTVHGASMQGTINVTAGADFSISVSNPNGGTVGGPIFPSQQTVFNGNLTAINAYNNSVSLSCQTGASSLPSPCTPNPTTAVPSAPFMITAGAATPGHYDFVARASDGTLTHSVSGLNFDVVDFGISAPAPSALTTFANATTASTSLSLTGAGIFSGTVSLACSGLPNGATCNFSPPGPYMPTASTSVPLTMTITVPTATPAQDYNVAVSATSSTGAGNMTKNQPLTLHVVDFNISPPSPTSVTAFPNATSSSASVNLSGAGAFAGSVALSCTGLPAGATCGFNPPGPYSPTASAMVPVTVTVNVPIATVAQDYGITVSALSGITKTQPLTLHVVQFSASALTPNPVTIGAGNLSNAASTTFTASPNFVNPGSVTMTCTAGVPAGGVCSFSPNNGVVNSFPSAPQSVVVSVPFNTPAASPNVTVTATGSSGGVVSAQDQSLTVNIPAPALSLGTPSPASLTMINNSFSPPISVQITPTNLAGMVTLSCQNLPAGVACHFVPSATVSVNGSPVTVDVIFEANGATTPSHLTNITINADATINGSAVSNSVGMTELDINAPGTTTDVTLNVAAVNALFDSTLINVGDPNLKITASVNNSGDTYGAARWEVGFSNPVVLVPASATNATCTQLLPTAISCNLGDVLGGSSVHSFKVAPQFERSLIINNWLTSATVGDSNLADNASTPAAVEVRPRPLARKGLVPKTP